MTRYLRTVMHLTPAQIVSRLALRCRAEFSRRAPSTARRWGAFRAGAVPELRNAAGCSRDYLRSCSEDAVKTTAAQVGRGDFEFLGVRRSLGRRPFPAPDDVSLLWAYHLEYMDYLLDLCLSGDTDTAASLCRARWDSEGVPRLSADHPYPTSRRAAAWLRILPWFSGEDRSLLAKGAWTFANRVARNLERDVGGNHLLENGLALALAGAAFRGRRAGGLRQRALEILTAGMREQVLPDGAHYELSPMYHARVLMVLLEGGEALERVGSSMPPDYWSGLARMAGFLDAIVDPEGELPLLGDTAREAGFDPVRFLEAVRDSLPVPVSPVPRGDHSFPDAGLYRFEDSTGDRRLLLDAGPVCPVHLPAHGQADTFSFELHSGGRAFVVDAGLMEYQAGPMRDWCRSTRAHSTVTVDDEDSSEVWSSFRVGRRARVRDVAWRVTDGRGTFTGTHDGYRHRGVAARRLVSHLDDGRWLVADRLAGRGPHRFASRIHLHPEVVVERESGGAFLLHRGGERLSVVPFGAEAVVVEAGWFCPSFGVRRRSQILRLDAAGSRARLGYVLSAGSVPTTTLDGKVLSVAAGDRRFRRELP